MKIKWLGHSCFVLETKNGMRILTDPYESGGYGGAVGYGKIDEEANIVTVSHSHADHNSVKSVPGRFDVVKDESQRNFNGIKIRGVKTFHDDCGGKERGENIVYIIEAEGLNICHLGDLGEVFSDEKAKEI
ncbi:MBL fold metallo-hydrolase, partial [candidate division WOR-3 bacterium]|nr:MBL fold metallo-hydrolase [candidate division WOR-3 bacterium]